MIELDQYGFGCLHTDKYTIPYLYTFAHFLDLSCTRLNHFTQVTYNSDPNTVDFDKVYRGYNGEYLYTRHIVRLVDNIISWSINIIEDHTSHSTNATVLNSYCAYGLTLEVDAKKIITPDKFDPELIIEYSPIWIPKWDCHSTLSIPIVQFSVQNQNIVAACPQGRYLQIVQFERDGRTYIKIGTETLKSLQFEVRFAAAQANTDMENIYYSLYPEYQRPNIMIASIKRIQTATGIKILFEQELQSRGLSMRQSCSYNEHFVHVIEKALQLYPQEIFSSIGLRRILLGDWIKQGTNDLAGVSANDSIFLSTNGTNESLLSLTLHHEIYHQIEKHFTSSERTELITKIKSTTKTAEVCAETFARRMADAAFICAVIETDHGLRALLTLINTFIKRMNSNFQFPTISIPSDPIMGMASTKINLTCPTTVIECKSIIGLRGCGSSLISKLFGDRIDVYEFNDKVDLSNISAYFVGHVLDYCAKMYFEQNIDAVDSAAIWTRTYNILHYTGKPFIRLEDVLRLNTHKVHTILGLTFDCSHIDPERLRPYDHLLVPFMNTVWQNVKTLPIIKSFEYN